MTPARPESRHESRPDAAPAAPAETPAATPGAAYAFPASSAQLRLWFLEQMAPGSPTYNLHVALRVTGPLDVPVLAHAVVAVSRRHEVLRTVFRDEAGEPVQLVAPDLDPAFCLVDVSARPDETGRLIDGEVGRGFDLATGPLLRVTVFRAAINDHVVVLVMHHIAADGWSMDVLVDELTAFYEAGRAGRTPSLPEPPIQYADFAVWQREWLTTGAAAAELDYWRGALAGAAPLALPTDRPRPESPSTAGANAPAVIPAPVVARMRALARAESASLYMVLLAGFQAVLARWSGQDDVVVGAPIANRTRPELERLIGFFVNLLALRTDLSGDPPFRELVGRARRVCLAAYAHQDLPFEELVKAVAPDRDATGAALVTVMLGLQNIPRRDIDLPDLHLRLLDTATATAKFDVSLSLAEEPDGRLVGHIEYRTELFDRETAERLISHLVAFLDAATADPSRRLSAVPLVRPAELERTLRAWQGAPCRTPPTCLHEQFEAVARTQPDRAAIVSAGASLTYAALDQRANRIAHHLAGRGVGRESLVALAATRSADWVAAALGILKAGAAYVPIDPDYPAERRDFLAADAGASVVVDDAFLADPAIASRPGSRLAVPAHPDQTAYVLYTSGSTGAPKGAVVTHRNVSHFLAAQRRDLELGAADAVLQIISVSFDPSIGEIFGALTAGGRLVMTGPRPQAEWDRVASIMAAEAVTVLFVTPSILRALLDASADPATWRAVRAVTTGGEVLHRGLRDAFARRAPGASLHNVYGPTEATVYVTRWTCRADDTRPLTPLGPTTGENRVYVLDAGGNLAPPGAIGELYLGGPQIARGYWRRPALTAERFVPSPFPGEAGQRLYRTGDFGRRRADGLVEFVGRRDEQVKVRGVRIELGEIEAALLRHPSIADAAVIIRSEASHPAGDQAGHDSDAALIAYVAPAVPVDLAGFLAGILPQALHPATVIGLASLPRTPGGKLDRAALPAPTVDAPGAADEPAARPSTPLEATLAEIWSRVLRAPVGMQTDFFAAGGDSLRAVRVVAQARKQGITLLVRDLFEHHTIEDLAAALAARTDAGARPRSIEPFSLLDPAERAEAPADAEDAYPASSLQAGMLLEAGDGAYQAAMSLHLRAPLDPDRLRGALAELTARHPALRTRFELHVARPVQVIERTAEIPLAIADLTGVDPAAADAAIAAWLDGERRRPFDRARAPLARVTVHRRDRETFQFTWTAHHAIVDGWSTAMLLEELFSLYFADRLPTAERPPDAGMRGLVALELDSLAAARSRDFWASYLEGADRFRLPVTPPPCGAGIERRVAPLPPALTEAVRALAAAEGVPVKSVVLAAHVAMLAVASGRSEVLTGVLASARPEAEGSDRLIGLFVSTLPLRCRVAGRTWAEILASVSADERAWQPHLRYPLSRIQAELGPVSLFDSIFGNNGVDVLQALPPVDGFETLGVQWDEETPVPLLVDLLEERGGGRIELVFAYRAAELGAAQVERLIGSLLRALEAMTADPGGRFDDADLLSDIERAAALADARAARPPAGPIDPEAAVAARARSAPHAVAVIADDAVLSYAELDRRANQLAHHLRERGAGPESIVGLCFERSADLLVAILACLRAGAAFLPLDPSYPDERLSLMLDRAGVGLVLAHAATRTRLAGQRVAPLLIDEPGALAGRPAAPPPPLAHPDHLAYVIFTSGSTGAPKAAAVSRRSLAHFTAAMRDTLALTGEDRFLQLAPLGFDVLVEEVFPVWAAGGAVVLPPGRGPFAPADVWSIAVEHGVTVFEVTTSYWQSLADWLERKNAPVPPGLRWILIGSEKVSTDRLGEWLARGAPLVHVYGVTEVACTSVVLRTPDVRGLLARAGGSLPIGWPIGHGTAYVLDRAGRPAAVGAVGELYLGGPQVARGYLHAPGLTAERFTPDPLAGEPGARMYRTGDLVRRLDGGAIEFVGRVDTQVQIRGHRVELGEVEAAIAALPGVREAVAVIRDDGAGGSLAAYYTVDAGADVSPARLRAHLRGRLPAYMVPAALVPLAAFPVSANGKIDRRALPEPAAAPVAAGRPPATDLERLIAGAWGRVLRSAPPTLDDNFFDAGGDSLLAMQLVGAIGDAAGVSLGLAALFDQPTVEGLAAAVAAQASRPAAPVAALTARPDRAAPAPLSSAQLRLWFLEQLAPGSPTYNMPAVQRVRGPLDVAALRASLEAIVHRHEALRTVIRVEHGRPVQVVLPGRPLGFAFADLSGVGAARREAEARAWIDAEVGRGFDLAAGPLLRAAVLRLGPLDHVVALIVHHGAADGWSMDVLSRELAELYGAIRAGRAPSLPELAIQYADFALWEERRLEGGELDGSIAAWRSALADLAPLALPLDRPRPVDPPHAGATRIVSVPPDVIAGLERIARQEGATLYMVLLAGFFALLSRWTGERDVSVGTPVAGRPRPELDGLIGCFFNVLLLRARVRDGGRFDELVRDVRAACVAAYADQEAPFDRVVRAVMPAERGRNALFQTMFIMDHGDHDPGAPPLGGDLAFEPWEVSLPLSRRDLTITMAPTGTTMSVTWNRDVLADETCAAVAAAYVHLLAAAAADPTRPLGSIPLALPARADLASAAPPAALDLERVAAEAERVRTAWRELLGPAGDDLDFFAAGGDSLLAVRLAARISAGLEEPMPLAWLFTTPTIAGLARAIAARRAATLCPGDLP